MKIFGYYITHKDIVADYTRKCLECEALDEAASRKAKDSSDAHIAYDILQKQYADLSVQLKGAEDTILIRDEDIKELRHRLEDTKSANAELNERLEKEMSDNCELQNLYAAKCKECEALEARTASIERNAIMMTEEEYNQLKADAEKFREDRDKHNANLRKRRAAKKVAQGKPV